MATVEATIQSPASAPATEDTSAAKKVPERVLHTMLRVGDMERSVKFYTEVLGMTLTRKKDFPDGKFTLAFLAYGPEETSTALELTHNWDTTSYDIGAAYGHVALACDDIYARCDAIRNAGGKVTREPGPMKHGTTVIAFVSDPDGYKIELIQRPNAEQPVLHTMLRVGDLDRSLNFYTSVLGMKLLRSKEYPSGKFTLAFVGYGPEETYTALELTYNWGTTSYDMGNAYGHIALATRDIYATCDAIRAGGGKIIREAGPMKVGATVIAFVEDPDGFKIELIEVNKDGGFPL
eukprot:CAMPEP_0196657298 /NCGR_PEP_ID=MMETSP1086-20130531/22560_1 /TAXON_ID=77921 /ORGANISM="Cyanoptyche  gloeocystis , Strain SAG4.97" /LENGTH=291 /DNA_ID=CAMNT_0041990365 /DNA_START=207 /DNA_END=1082 /DNA_ORIENTATION=+